jgi:RimJ/RimL family protein N-acetyltransferase
VEVVLKKASRIQTNRLELKPYSDSDLEDMVCILCNDEIKKTFMIPDFETKDDAIKMFYKVKEWSFEEERFEYGVYQNDQLIGFVNDVEINKDLIEIGYVIHPNYKNQGYATEVLSAVLKELFRIGYTHVKAGLFEENVASRRVMEKCGMKITKEEDDIEYQGKIHHCIYFEKWN